MTSDAGRADVPLARAVRVAATSAGQLAAARRSSIRAGHCCWRPGSMSGRSEGDEITVCLAIYLGAQQPLRLPARDQPDDFEMREVTVVPSRFRRRTRRRQEWLNALRDRMQAQHVLEIKDDCACVFIPDGEDPRNPERQRALEGLRRHVEAALETGPTTVLVSWMGEELHEGTERLTVSADEIEDLDFDSAWDRPFLVQVS